MTESSDNNQEPQEVSFYEKLAARTAELLEEGKKTFDEALKKSKEELAKAGGYTAEQADRVAEWVKRDVVEGAGKATEVMQKVFEPHRVAAGAQSVLGRILAGTADALSELAKKTERSLEFKTGEVTGAGTLTCKGCGATMSLSQTSHIPPCAKCHATVFRKSY